jgi:L-asparaginase II
VVRSGFAESVHRGSVVVLSADGEVLKEAGETRRTVFPRSSSKPMQAAAMVRCGLDLDDRLLALAAASHSGEDFHVAGVREILAGAGLDPTALRCPPAMPLDTAAQRALIRSGGSADRLHMNCSGKHAAMLATCVAAGWPADGYTGPGHPLQREIRRVIEGLAGETAGAVGVDGCGAALFGLSLTGLARAFQAIVRAGPGTPERRVADAIRAHPDWNSGTNREERTLMEAVPGLLIKAGAEAVEAFALTDGRAAAFKIDDGGQRARVPVTVALLNALGALPAGHPDLGRLAAPPVYGGGTVVGEIRARLPF